MNKQHEPLEPSDFLPACAMTASVMHSDAIRLKSGERATVGAGQVVDELRDATVIVAHFWRGESQPVSGRDIAQVDRTWRRYTPTEFLAQVREDAAQVAIDSDYAVAHDAAEYLELLESDWSYEFSERGRAIVSLVWAESLDRAREERGEG